jgi:hypothetical protein
MASLAEDKRFLLRKFELEFLLQVFSQLLFDFFGFRFWANKPKKEVVGIPYIVKASEVGVVGHHRGEGLGLVPQFLRLFDVPFLSLIPGVIDEALVLRVFPLLLSPGVSWNEDRFYKLV